MSEAIAVRQQVLALREPLRGEDPLAYAMAQATLARELAGRDNTEAARLLGEAIPAIERLAPDSRDLVVALRARSNLDMFLDDGAARQRSSIRIRALLMRLPPASPGERIRAAAIVPAGPLATALRGG